jgi:predicted AAA+ superfamily ATPase
MIPRTIWSRIEYTIQNRPVTLITGARQVGKTVLCGEIVKKYNFNYVSLDNLRKRASALSDPEMFLELHPSPLIIDEVQQAPVLFEAIEAKVNETKFSGGNHYGMYVLTGSQAYKLMENVSESMAGRVGIIKMNPLSMSEIRGQAEEPFLPDIRFQNRVKEYSISPEEMYRTIVRGFFPELYDNPDLKADHFYADYTASYIERDVPQSIHLKDKLLFQNFMEVLGSLTGEELVYDTIAKSVGITVATAKAWISVLAAGNIIWFLQPYHETSVIKRIVKRPKMYFTDTGLACWLARLNNAEVLQNSMFNGRFVETYIINEIRKSYTNNGIEPGMYYYRDTNQNEIDLVLLQDAKLHLVECKAGISFTKKNIKAFSQLKKSRYPVGTSCIVCNTPVIYPIDKDVIALPLSAI